MVILLFIVLCYWLIGMYIVPKFISTPSGSALEVSVVSILWLPLLIISIIEKIIKHLKGKN